MTTNSSRHSSLYEHPRYEINEKVLGEVGATSLTPVCVLNFTESGEKQRG